MNANISEIIDEEATVDEAELEIAEKEAEEGSDVYTYKFKKPVYHDGRQIDDMTFNWDKLTGRDSLAIDAEARSSGTLIAARAFSEFYLVRMAARANDKKAGLDFFERLPLRAYNDITNSARGFLIRSES